jgi:hypothetical protein
MSEDVCSIDWDAEARAVIMVWRGYATTPQFRDGNERVLAGIEAHGAKKILADITDFKLIAAADQEWLNAEFIPRLMRAGVRHVGMVTPVYYFNRVAVQNVADRIDPDALTLRYFGDRASARAWLLEV